MPTNENTLSLPIKKYSNCFFILCSYSANRCLQIPQGATGSFGFSIVIATFSILESGYNADATDSAVPSAQVHAGKAAFS